jgi:hypothetical protein
VNDYLFFVLPCHKGTEDTTLSKLIGNLAWQKLWGLGLFYLKFYCVTKGTEDPTLNFGNLA